MDIPLAVYLPNEPGGPSFGEALFFLLLGALIAALLIAAVRSVTRRDKD
jgi:hypothetical protein